MKTLSLLLIALISALAACSESPSDGSSAGAPAESPGESPPESSPSGVLLSYERSGGFAGLTDRLEVRSDGRAELVADDAPQRPFEVPPELMERLRAELENLDWARANSEPRDVECSDCYVYRIRSGSHTLTTTAMGESGEELGELLALVEEIKASASGR